MSDAEVQAGFAKFGGVKRRFTKVGEIDGVTVIDDYGHHPVEIRAVLAAAREGVKGPRHRGGQPHRYSRLGNHGRVSGRLQRCRHGLCRPRLCGGRGTDRRRFQMPPNWSARSSGAGTIARRKLPAPMRWRKNWPHRRRGRHGRLPWRGRHHQMGGRACRRDQEGAGG
jgi:hypothetical protein